MNLAIGLWVMLAGGWVLPGSSDQSNNDQLNLAPTPAGTYTSESTQPGGRAKRSSGLELPGGNATAAPSRGAATGGGAIAWRRRNVPRRQAYGACPPCG